MGHYLPRGTGRPSRLIGSKRSYTYKDVLLTKLPGDGQGRESPGRPARDSAGIMEEAPVAAPGLRLFFLESSSYDRTPGRLVTPHWQTARDLGPFKLRRGGGLPGGGTTS